VKGKRAASGRPSLLQVQLGGYADRMSEKEQQDELTPEELEEQNGEELPDREVMSTIDFSPGPMPLDPDPGGYTNPIEPNPTE
jgi:hypothetical protein